MRTRRRFRFLLIILSILLLIVVAAPLWLPAIGNFLIATQPPEKADALYVFAGDAYGRRILRAAELAQQGYAKQVLVGSPMPVYGQQEGDLAIAFAVSTGFPRDLFVPIYFQAHSTREEIHELDRIFHERNIHSVVAVTSDFHTRRAARMLRNGLSPDIRFTMTGAADEFFRADSWWKNREASKTVFLEWTKTVTSLFGL